MSLVLVTFNTRRCNGYSATKRDCMTQWRITMKNNWGMFTLDFTRMRDQMYIDIHCRDWVGCTELNFTTHLSRVSLISFFGRDASFVSFLSPCYRK
jgi:hypothetical protein